MICRLCLERHAEFVAIFDANNEIVQHEIVKIVLKYLDVELLHDDKVSNNICQKCWRQLQKFHTFVLHIQQKQEELRQQQLLTKDMCGAKDKHEDVLMENCMEEEQFLTNLPLYEPEIDVRKRPLPAEDKEFYAADLDDMPGSAEKGETAHVTNRGKTQIAQSQTARKKTKKIHHSRIAAPTARVEPAINRKPCKLCWVNDKIRRRTRFKCIKCATLVCLQHCHQLRKCFKCINKNSNDTKVAHNAAKVNAQIPDSNKIGQISIQTNIKSEPVDTTQLVVCAPSTSKKSCRICWASCKLQRKTRFRCMSCTENVCVEHSQQLEQCFECNSTNEEEKHEKA